jgi:ubiquinone/menaquinone biosynthesis C-methylase UbiE
MSSSFDADTRALATRAHLNSEGAKRNLEEWILEHVTPRPGSRVLDLGCGTGKQLFALSEHILPGGAALGLDISADAVDAVNSKARELGWPHIEATQGGLDDCVAAFDGQRFELILSCYAIYYSHDMLRLLLDLHGLLAPRGTLFICGPGEGTNEEILDLVRAVARSDDHGVRPVEDFVSPDQLEALSRRYSRVTVVRLSNPVEFPSARSVLDWWRNHNSYVPELDSAVDDRLTEHFAHLSSFTITKQVLGVVADA